MEILLIVATGVFAALFNLIAIPNIISISHKFNWYDKPGKRKIHKDLIPRLGGVGIFSAFFASIIIIPPFYGLVLNTPFLYFIDLKYITIFLSFFIIYFLGLIDDFYDLRAIFKLFIQIFAASIIVASGFYFKSISIPYIGSINLGFIGYPLTIIWIVGITNAMNLVDGMDGLCGGIAAFAAFSMGIISFIGGEIIPALMAFALFGAILGFLKYNFPPAKIFMGDSGSLFLGFALSVIPLMGISKAGALGSLLFPVTVLMVPIVDTIAAIIRRIRNKKSIAAPDKEHLHHKLLELGFSEKKILAVIYTICLYLSIIAVTSVILPIKEVNVYFILIVWVGSMLSYGILHIILSKKRVSQHKENENKNKYIL